jgi:hypothetical protein
VRENKRGGSPSNCKLLFPGRKKELNKGKQMVHTNKTKKKWSAALTVSMSNKI